MRGCAAFQAGRQQPAAHLQGERSHTLDGEDLARNQEIWTNAQSPDLHRKTPIAGCVLGNDRIDALSAGLVPPHKPLSLHRQAQRLLPLESSSNAHHRRDLAGLILLQARQGIARNDARGILAKP